MTRMYVVAKIIILQPQLLSQLNFSNREEMKLKNKYNHKNESK